ncbi:DUF1127 domain-containing protein [Caenispirillum bisanense]|uniref:Uncharacterized conserved protein YjiS, DUF1127 family n=1 Tax=Caenispirillum bisanense TaxID=414052 RepID=A0A286GNV7_9PROT|nr:DUF1127 domain-containing protein [Caenispirillum bisanense]SOD96654.1 Uncharacterized conserved protein YjiS, DUF1127 family [Caenispirillum bisanense]
MTTRNCTVPARHAAAGPERESLARRPALASALLVRLAEWTHRARARAELRRLSDRALSDIGLSRSHVEREAAKPFWRP